MAPAEGKGAPVFTVGFRAPRDLVPGQLSGLTCGTCPHSSPALSPTCALTSVPGAGSSPTWTTLSRAASLPPALCSEAVPGLLARPCSAARQRAPFSAGLPRSVYHC